MRLIRKIDNFLEDKKYRVIIEENLVNIINFSEIIDFSINHISLRCANVVVKIEGDRLAISKMMDNEVLVSGTINNISIN